MSDLILSSRDFKTLSSDTRVQIIKLLGSRNYNLTELSSKLDLAMPSIKQHIDVLLDSGLIEQVDSSHKWKYYSLSRKGKKLVQPVDTKILIVLAGAFIGLLGIAVIASSLFGAGSQLGIAGDQSAIREAQPKIFSNPEASGISAEEKLATTASGNIDSNSDINKIDDFLNPQT